MPRRKTLPVLTLTSALAAIATCLALLDCGQSATAVAIAAAVAASREATKIRWRIEFRANSDDDQGELPK